MKQILSVEDLKNESVRLNNFFQTEDNLKLFEENDYFLISNKDGDSILEVSKREKAYRHAIKDDFCGIKQIPSSHIEARDYIFYLLNSYDV